MYLLDIRDVCEVANDRVDIIDPARDIGWVGMVVMVPSGSATMGCLLFLSGAIF